MKYDYDENTKLSFFKINVDEEIQFALENIVMASIARPDEKEAQQELCDMIYTVSQLRKENKKDNSNDGLNIIFDKLEDINNVIIRMLQNTKK